MESLLTNTATIENTSMIRTKILVPTGVTNTFLTSKRGKPLYCNKKWPKISGPKLFATERFHCISIQMKRTQVVL